ncbi:MAG: hypothetical protein FJX48_06605 [Alphaproteobacteria bacterium]|nr:hypothetical protein [Alphaproteobacteria bacterium]
MNSKRAAGAATLLAALAGGSLSIVETLTGSEYLSSIASPSGGHVGTNVELKALSIRGKASGYEIFRQGFYAPFDGGGQHYYLSLSACSPGASGNDFTQVAPNVGTGCWLAASAPEKGYDLRAAGMRAGDVVTYQSANNIALTKILAVGGAIFMPGGAPFRLPCNARFSSSTDISFAGNSADPGTLKLDSGCTLSTDLFVFVDASPSFYGVRIDENNPTATLPRATIAQGAHAADITGLVFENSSIINSSTLTLQIALLATAGHTISYPKIIGSYFQLTPATTQNQCINLSTNNFAGDIRYPVISGNECVGSTILAEGLNPDINNNTLSGYLFGQGIALGAAIGPLPSTRGCRIEGNIFRDTTPGSLDVNVTPPGGIENNCFNSYIANNTCDNLGGPCITTFADETVLVSNKARDVGKGQANYGAHAAYTIIIGSAGTARDASSHVTMIGNVAEQGDTPGAPGCGLVIAPNVAGRIEGYGNQFAGADGSICAPASIATIDPRLSHAPSPASPSRKKSDKP